MTITKKEIASIRIKPCKAVSTSPKEESDAGLDEELEEQGAETSVLEERPSSEKPEKGSDEMPGLFDDVD